MKQHVSVQRPRTRRAIEKRRPAMRAAQADKARVAPLRRHAGTDTRRADRCSTRGAAQRCEQRANRRSTATCSPPPSGRPKLVRYTTPVPARQRPARESSASARQRRRPRAACGVGLPRRARRPRAACQGDGRDAISWGEIAPRLHLLAHRGGGGARAARWRRPRASRGSGLPRRARRPRRRPRRNLLGDRSEITSVAHRGGNGARAARRRPPRASRGVEPPRRTRRTLRRPRRDLQSSGDSHGGGYVRTGGDGDGVGSARARTEQR